MGRFQCFGKGSVPQQPESYLGNGGDDPGEAGQGKTQDQDLSDLTGESEWTSS